MERRSRERSTKTGTHVEKAEDASWTEKNGFEVWPILKVKVKVKVTMLDDAPVVLFLFDGGWVPFCC